MKKTEIFLPILKDTKEITLSSLKDKSNSDYCLLDTSSVLKLLPRLSSLVHRLNKEEINLAIPEETIEQVIEHLAESFSKRKKQQASIYDIEEGMRNFVKLLDDERILKVFSPTKIPTKYKKKYKEFVEDEILAFVLFEGKFKGVVTEDEKLKKKIPKGKIVISYKDLL